MNNKIEFLGIGAARSGSTWLWSVLKQHPEIWMPPIKELHYFDRSTDYPSPSMLADDHFIDRFLGKEKNNAAFRLLLFRSLGKTVLYPQKWGELGWKLRYFFGTCNDKWYLSLFDVKKKATKGEITPAYSILSREDVHQVHALLPNLKIIYLIRNPMDRAWSAIRYRWARETIDINNFEDVIQKIDSPSQAHRSDYFRTIRNWTSSFSKPQFQIYFFDDIIVQPQHLIEKILTFLEVDPTLPIPIEKLTAKVNASQEKLIPEKVKHYLAQKYYSEVKELIPIVGGYSEDWLKKIEENL